MKEKLRFRLWPRLWVVIMAGVIAGCARAAPPSKLVSAPKEAPAPIAPKESPALAPAPTAAPPPAPAAEQPVVPAVVVTAMLRETTSRAHTLTWQYGEVSGRAGYRLNGDRFYLPDSGQGFVQTGLRAWRVLVDPKKGMTWDMVYSGGLSQLPFLEDVRLHPENWGVAPLIPAGTSFRKESVAADRETWLGTLPEQASVTWHGQPRSLRQVRVTVIKQGAVYLPVRWETLAAGNDPGGVMIGTYTWADPVIPEAPPFPNRDAGLFNVWLGESRESVEPLRFAAAERRTEAGGATWAIGNGVAIKYDAAGKVILLSQTKWDLLNGLAIGDSADAAVRSFGPAARGDQSVLVYDLPRGNRLEIYLYQGRIKEFRVMAAGQ